MSRLSLAVVHLGLGDWVQGRSNLTRLQHLLHEIRAPLTAWVLLARFLASVTGAAVPIPLTSCMRTGFPPEVLLVLGKMEQSRTQTLRKDLPGVRKGHILPKSTRYLYSMEHGWAFIPFPSMRSQQTANDFCSSSSHL